MAGSVSSAVHCGERLFLHQETMEKLSGESETLDAEKRAGIKGSDL